MLVVASFCSGCGKCATPISIPVFILILGIKRGRLRRDLGAVLAGRRDYAGILARFDVP